jgi:hypothetical protein
LVTRQLRDGAVAISANPTFGNDAGLAPGLRLVVVERFEYTATPPFSPHGELGGTYPSALAPFNNIHDGTKD